jgi:hypothetical protein
LLSVVVAVRHSWEIPKVWVVLRLAVHRGVRLGRLQRLQLCQLRAMPVALGLMRTGQAAAVGLVQRGLLVLEATRAALVALVYLILSKLGLPFFMAAVVAAAGRQREGLGVQVVVEMEWSTHPQREPLEQLTRAAVVVVRQPIRLLLAIRAVAA